MTAQANVVNQLVIEGLAQDAARDRERMALLAAERDSYRMWFKRAVHVLHGLIHENDRQSDRIIEQGQAILELREDIKDLSAEVRELRETMAPDAGAGTIAESDGAWLQ